MNTEELKNMLELHAAWLRNESEGKRANLQGANLREAILQGANLQGANLQGAILQGVDLDFSCWPMWCGSLTAQIDDRFSRQLMYHCLSVSMTHLLAAGFSEKELTKLKVYANGFHRVTSGDCKEL